MMKVSCHPGNPSISVLKLKPMSQKPCKSQENQNGLVILPQPLLINFGILSETYYLSESSYSPTESRATVLSIHQIIERDKYDHVNGTLCKQWLTIQTYGFDIIITRGHPMLTIYLYFVLFNWILWQRNSHKMMKSFA